MANTSIIFLFLLSLPMAFGQSDKEQQDEKDQKKQRENEIKEDVETLRSFSGNLDVTPRSSLDGKMRCVNPYGIAQDYSYCLRAIAFLDGAVLAAGLEKKAEEIVSAKVKKDVDVATGKAMEEKKDLSVAGYDASIKLASANKTQKQRMAGYYGAHATTMLAIYRGWPTQPKPVEGVDMKNYPQVMANSQQRKVLLQIALENGLQGFNEYNQAKALGKSVEQMKKEKEAYLQSLANAQQTKEFCEQNPEDPLCKTPNFDTGNTANNNPFQGGTSNSGSSQTTDDPFFDPTKNRKTKTDPNIINPIAGANNLSGFDGPVPSAAQKQRGTGAGGSIAGGAAPSAGSAPGSTNSSVKRNDNSANKNKKSPPGGAVSGDSYAKAKSKSPHVVAAKNSKEDENPFAKLFGEQGNQGPKGGVEEVIGGDLVVVGDSEVFDRSPASEEASNLFQRISEQYIKAWKNKQIKVLNVIQ